MEITLFGIKIRVELAIACMILGAVICYMLFCSCSLKEGYGVRRSKLASSQGTWQRDQLKQTGSQSGHRRLAALIATLGNQ